MKSDHLWYAIKIRSRSEAAIAKALSLKGFELFLPTYKQPRRYSDRIRSVDAPLFPGYLFSRLDLNARLPLLTTAGVEYIVGIEKSPEPVPEHEINALRLVVQSGAAAKPWPYLRHGSRVRVEFGALSGVEGILLAEKGVDRLVLSVTLLQRSVSVEIDRAWIKPI